VHVYISLTFKTGIIQTSTSCVRVEIAEVIKSLPYNIADTMRSSSLSLQYWAVWWGHRGWHLCKYWYGAVL